MRTRLRVAILLVVAFWAGSLSAAEPAGDGIDWQPWSDGIFERAKAEKKLVLLDLGAVWCHWCHVMDEQTYRDPEVIRLLRDRYIAVRVDQDARPDLSNRYEDYGWPATIVFKWDGSELAKRRGYIPPKPMASMLQAFVDDPTPGPSVQEEAPITPSSATALSDAQRVEMRKALTDAYDRERGGWGTVHKYLNWDALEFSLIEGAGGDSEMKEMARRTLISGQKLIDPAWGGVYQYSTDGDWDHPHFEKIMPFQAENLRVFAIAATLDPDPRWMGSARKIRAYLKNFLTSPEGAFYTSQDADRVQGEHSAKYFALGDRERRKLGVPRIDRHVYSRENGTAITGLCALYASSGDASCLADAERAAKWVLEHRSLPGGGFRHDERDSAGPYLADSLQMARAFLALYTVTADRAWLARAQTAADFIDSNFRGDAGFATSAKSAASALPPKLQVDENVVLARFASLLYQQTGKEAYRSMAERSMRYLASPAVVRNLGFSTSGVLLADREMRRDSAHVTIVGSRSDSAARRLFLAALRGAPPASRIEWWDPKEGPLPRGDVEYPQLPESAAFLCANGACSIPIRTPEALSERLIRLVRR